MERCFGTTMVEKKTTPTIQYKRLLIKKMLEAIGEDTKREGLKGTPERVQRMWDEIFAGYNEKLKPNVTTFTNGKDGIVYDEMINDSGYFYSMCEHHMVPFIGRYWFAYVPNINGKLLGLSKVARVVDFYSARLQIQERLTHEVVQHLWDAIDQENFRPVAMGLVMEAEHLCKSMRGVKKRGMMRTTKLLGTLKDDVAARQEFLGWVAKNGGL